MERMTEWRGGHGSLLRGDGYTKLARYEDTGMEPEEIHAILEVFPAWRLKELCEASGSGRLNIVPCKKGDSLWGYYTYPKYGIQEAKVLAVSTLDGETVINTDTYGVIPASDVGTNVFLNPLTAEGMLADRKKKDKEKRSK